jgi:histone H3
MARTKVKNQKATGFKINIRLPINPPKVQVRKKSKKQNALSEIRKYQKSVNLLIPKAPFKRLVKEITMERNPFMKVSKMAIEAVQEAAEAHIVDSFNDINLAAIHAKRITVMPKDLQFVGRVKS